MTQTAINWAELVQDVTDEVRKGVSLDDALVDVSRDYDASIAVLRARFEKAHPNGVMAAPPSEDEMLARHRAEVKATRAKAEAEHNAIVEFFNANPAIKQQVRQNITKFTGKRSCNMRIAKAIADRIAK